MGKKFHKILGIGIIAAGLLLFLYPDIRTFLFNRETQHTVEEFEESFVTDASGSLEDSTKESLLVLYSSSVYRPSPRSVCYTVWRYCGLVKASYHSMV